MEELLELINSIKPSEPIFKLNVGSDDRITAQCTELYNITESNNPLLQLVKNNYFENFDMHRMQFEVDTTKIIARSVQDIMKAFRDFVQTELKLINPRRSKLWRWLYYTNHSNELDNIMILLYKYYKSDQMTKNNVMGILTAIMEKYDKSRR